MSFVAAGRDYFKDGFGTTVTFLCTSSSLESVRSWLADRWRINLHSSARYKEFIVNRARPVLTFAKLDPESRAQRALFGALADEVASGDISKRDISIASFLGSGALSQLPLQQVSGQSNKVSLSSLLEGLLEASLNLHERSTVGYRGAFHGTEEHQERRRRLMKAAQCLSDLGISAPEKLRCLNLCLKDAAPTVRARLEPRITRPMLAIKDPQVARDNFSKAAQMLSHPKMPPVSGHTLQSVLLFDGTYVRRSSDVLFAGLGVSDVGGIVGGKWHMLPHADLSFLVAHEFVSAYQASDGSTAATLPSEIQREHLATQVALCYCIVRADCYCMYIYIHLFTYYL